MRRLGEDCKMAEMATYHALILDEYGSSNELEMVREYWPSYADSWFKAIRGGD